MTQTPTPLSEAHCLTTNPHYRTTILTVCRDCFQTAETRKEFQTMMDTIERITNALDAVGRWNQ